MNKPKLIVLVGLPGCGKSTYAKKLLDPQGYCRYVSSDQLREELFGDEAIQGDPKTVFKHVHDKTKQLLTTGYDVVYDATNVTRKNRKNIVQQFGKIADIEAHIVWAPFNECVVRDRERKRTVGEDVISKFLHRWQSPYYDEGFSKIKLVFNCNVGWDRVHYNNCLLENMNIDHENPHHSLNIADHCAEAENYVLNKYGNPVLCEAAAFHDCGKPMTKGFKSDENGRMIPVAHYYQHDNVGGYLVYGCYGSDNMNRAIQVSWIVCNHMQPYFQSKYYKEMDASYKKNIDIIHEADVHAH